MNNDDRLKKLVDATKNEKPLFSIAEIEKVLDQKAVAKTPDNLTIKITLMSTLAIITSFILIYFNSAKNESNISETQVESTSFSNEQEATLLKKENINYAPEITKKSRIDSVEKPDHQTRVVYNIVPYKSSENERFVYSEKTLNNNEKPILEDYLPELNEDEWAKLNINIGRKKLEYSIKKPNDTASHYLMFAYNYAEYTSHKKGSFSSTEDERLLPLGVSQNDGSRFVNFRADANKVMDSLKNEQLIIGLKTPMANHLIVWYSINSELSSALPNNIAYKLNNNELQYKCTFSHGKLLKPGDEVIVKKPRIIGSKQYTVKILETPFVDSSLITNDISFDANTVLYAKESQLNELGAHIEGAELKLSGKIFSGNVEFTVANGRSFISRNGMTPKGKSKDVLPIYISGQRISDPFYGIYPNFYFGTYAYQHFLTKRQNFLPVAVKIPANDSTLILWYEPSFALFEKLGYEPTKQRELMQKFITSGQANSTTKLTNAELSFKNDNNRLANQGIKLLELDKATLANLEIFVENEEIIYFKDRWKYNFHKAGTDMTFRATGKLGDDKEKQVTIEIPNATGGISYTIDSNANILAPKYITDDLAQMWRVSANPSGVDVRTPNRIEVIDSLMRADMTNNFLIPVIVKSGTNYTALDKTLNRMRPDCIFWYEPTEEFLNHLPDSIAKGIRAEIEHLVYTDIIYQAKEDSIIVEKAKAEIIRNENENPEQCNYFEACMDQTLTVSEFKVYPNPVKELLFVNVESSETCSGELIITDIKGRQLATTQINIEEGTNSYSIPVNELNEGIFLLTLTTSKGDLKTQRIIKVN